MIIGIILKTCFNINYLDSTTELENFEIGDQNGIYRSCSFSQNGKMYIFGGHPTQDYNGQISTVDSCRLNRIGELPFVFDLGACNNFISETGTEIGFLCFSDFDQNGCFR